ncbi:MAG: energy-coupling factor ABC transporter permease [Candidatus Omnitrophica bacterium]|nr:energy-coupling factor ABC transporter permease [Candidatus Omnitrophota bacterium]
MHIPNEMLNGTICPVTAVVSALGVGLAAFFAFRSKTKPQSAKFAAITALIFAGQMMNFPINGGTSGHLLGGVLASSLLGIPFGVLSMALVVTIQCLVFADGGFTVLGANILNMAIIGAGLGGLIYAALNRNRDSVARVGIAAWCAVMLAALVCSIELALSGTIGFFQVAGAMLSTHAFIGIGEALITVAVCAALRFEVTAVSQRRSVTVPLIASGIIATLLSPFASGLPDGLEWVAEKYSFLHESAPAFVSPLPDYTVSAISNEMLATGLAGLIGVALTFLVAWLVAKGLTGLETVKTY